ncbi:MAG: hypothetical protein WDM76_13005 [Limisphaerales bacterium]
MGQDFSDYDREETEYSSAVQKAQQALEALGRVQLIDRSFLSNFAFGPNDIVVVLDRMGWSPTPSNIWMASPSSA